MTPFFRLMLFTDRPSLYLNSVFLCCLSMGKVGEFSAFINTNLRGICAKQVRKAAGTNNPHVRSTHMYHRLPSYLRPTIRECAHLITRGHFRSRDKDGGHTIRSAIVENPMPHANFMVLFYSTGECSYCRSKSFNITRK